MKFKIETQQWFTGSNGLEMYVPVGTVMEGELVEEKCKYCNNLSKTKLGVCYDHLSTHGQVIIPKTPEPIEEIWKHHATLEGIVETLVDKSNEHTRAINKINKV